MVVSVFEWTLESENPISSGEFRILLKCHRTSPTTTTLMYFTKRVVLYTERELSLVPNRVCSPRLRRGLEVTKKKALLKKINGNEKVGITLLQRKMTIKPPKISPKSRSWHNGYGKLCNSNAFTSRTVPQFVGKLANKVSVLRAKRAT